MPFALDLQYMDYIGYRKHLIEGTICEKRDGRDEKRDRFSNRQLMTPFVFCMARYVSPHSSGLICFCLEWGHTKQTTRPQKQHGYGHTQKARPTHTAHKTHTHRTAYSTHTHRIYTAHTEHTMTDSPADAIVNTAKVLLRRRNTRRQNKSHNWFKSMFGTVPVVVCALWDMVVVEREKGSYDAVLPGFVLSDFLCGLLFLKLYLTEVQHATLLETTRKTFRMKAWASVKAIAALHLVSCCCRGFRCRGFCPPCFRYRGFCCRCCDGFFSPILSRCHAAHSGNICQNRSIGKDAVKVLMPTQLRT